MIQIAEKRRHRQVRHLASFGEWKYIPCDDLAVRYVLEGIG
jgi:hypothetical protein